MGQQRNRFRFRAILEETGTDVAAEAGVAAAEEMAVAVRATVAGDAGGEGFAG